jgi:hypothetical protein
MLGTLIHFPPKFQVLHTQFVVLIGKSFGTTKVSSSVKSINMIQGPGRSFNELLVELKCNTDISLWYTPKRIRELLVGAKFALQGAVIPQNGTVEDAFYMGLCSRYVAGTTIASYLLQTMRENSDDLKSANAKAYEQCCGYLLLLNAILSYNAAVIFSSMESEKLSLQIHLNKCFDWMALFEELSLPTVGNNFCIELRKLLAKSMADFQTALLNKQRALPEKSNNKSLLPAELVELVKAKTKRAQRFGTTYQGVIIHHAQSELMNVIDPIAMKELVEQISVIYESKVNEHPTQFIFYCNQNFGPIELLSVYFNPQSQEIELVSLSLGKSALQHSFLHYLNTSLCNKKVKFSVLACQADLLPEQSFTQLYAFAFSGILAKAVFEVIRGKYQCSQPSFYSVVAGKIEEMPMIHNVQWFNVVALGDKAILMAPSYQRMQTLFEAVYGKLEAQRRIKFYMRKYDLVVSDQFIDKFHHFYEYFFNKHQGHSFHELSIIEIESRLLDDEFDESRDIEASKSLLSLFDHLSSVKNDKKEPTEVSVEKMDKIFLGHIFTPKDRTVQLDQEAKTLRRAAAGYCPLQEFEFVLEKFSHMTIAQNPINLTDQNQLNSSLHLALSRDLPKRALLLLECNADKKVKNKAGKSPEEIYAELPSHSQVRRNTKIRDFFK